MAVTAFLAFVGILAFRLFLLSYGRYYHLNYNCGLLVLCTICLFELFSRMQVIPCKPFYAHVAKYSFAMYLTHMPILLILRHYFRASFLSWHTQVVVLWLAAAVLSYLAAVAIHKIPRIGGLLLYMKE